MASHSFQTLLKPSTGIYKEKGSKFLAFAYPVQGEEEVKEKIRLLKKEYFDARHHGYAWILGPEKDRFRAFDDGEPNHSTGDPILGQIKSRNLTNVLVVVVRYFGGTKLGVGGLIAAYRAAADDALSKATVVEQEVMEHLELKYNYSATPEVMRLVKDFNLTILEQEFGEGSWIRVAYAIRYRESLMDKLRLLIALGNKLELKVP